MAKNLDQKYIDLIQIEGLDKVESFKKCFPAECEGKSEEDIIELASKRLKRGKNEEYYVAKSKQFELQEKEKAEWNREVFNQKATSLLNSLYDRAIDNNRPNEKMAVLKTITDLMRELNLVNGLQENRTTQIINPIQIVNVNKLKTYDENGNIVDGDFTEVENGER